MKGLLFKLPQCYQAIIWAGGQGLMPEVRACHFPKLVPLTLSFEGVAVIVWR